MQFYILEYGRPHWNTGQCNWAPEDDKCPQVIVVRTVVTGRVSNQLSRATLGVIIYYNIRKRKREECTFRYKRC
jgi:hypothetical protein